MLKNNLSDIPAIALLRSEAIVVDLLDFISGWSSLGFFNRSDAFTRAVHNFAPNRFRSNDLEAALAVNLPAGYSRLYSFDFLDMLFDKYFLFDGSSIVASHEVAESYSSLIKYVHPYGVTGRKIARLLKDGRISTADVLIYARHTSPLCLGKFKDGKSYAENHLHFGGANESHSNLLHLANDCGRRDSGKVRNFKFSDLPRITAFPLLTSEMFTIHQILDIYNEVHQALNAKILYNGNLSDSMNKLEWICRGRERHTFQNTGVTLDYCTRIHFNNQSDLHVLFRATLNAYARGEEERAWFLYNVLLHYLDLSVDCSNTRIYIRIFLHVSNILRSYMVMSESLGLTNFVTFFRSWLRKDYRHNSHRNTARNIILNGTSHIEGRFSPEAITDGGINAVMAALDETMTEGIVFGEGESGRSGTTPELVYPGLIPYHFCIHFTRRPDDCSNHLDTPSTLPPRHSQVREQVERMARRIDQVLSKCHMKCQSSFDILRKRGNISFALSNRQHLDSRCLDLSRLITTLDVAGDENVAPTEVYAPAIRYLRRQVNPIAPLMQQNLYHHQQFRLAIHAGEDFAHIVTGLRKIDETVTFCHYAPGDRLGHALALGIQPSCWAERTQECYVTTGEYFDNLVWLWKKCIEVGQVYPSAIAYAKKCETEISILGLRIYGDGTESRVFTPTDYYQAWLLRRNCPLTWLSRGKSLSWRYDPFVEAFLPDIELLEKEVPASNLYMRYHSDGLVRANAAKPLCIRYVKHSKTGDINGNFAEFTDDDLAIWEAIQDFLITAYAERKIIIEANPSSNVYIGDMDGFTDHPIFRWDPPKTEYLNDGAIFNKFGLRKGPMAVCINSDDPSIFLTTLQNEFRLVKEAAIKKFKVNVRDVEDWAERIRTRGVEVFETCHADPVVWPRPVAIVAD